MKNNVFPYCPKVSNTLSLSKNVIKTIQTTIQKKVNDMALGYTAPNCGSDFCFMTLQPASPIRSQPSWAFAYLSCLPSSDSFRYPFGGEATLVKLIKSCY